MKLVLYLITNLINGKYYVGKTKRGSEQRWKEHASPDQQSDPTNTPVNPVCLAAGAQTE